MATQVSIENGKYTVVMADTGEMYALRNGELWRELTGDKMVCAMACEIERLRKIVEEHAPHRLTEG